jgi:phosphate-selective porin OprO/OprP
MWQDSHKAKPFHVTHKQCKAGSFQKSPADGVYPDLKNRAQPVSWEVKKLSSPNGAEEGDMFGTPKTGAYLFAAVLAAGVVAPGEIARAQDLQAIQAQIEALQATVEELKRQVAEAKAEAAAARAAAQRSAPVAVASSSGGGKGDLDLKVKWKGAPEFTSADEKKFKFKIRGRLETDYNHIDQDSAITFAPDVSATALRRARIGVEGVMFYDWKYILEVDFANDETRVRDAYLQYTGLPVDLTVGNFKTPNSLENMTSANYITFMERAAFVEAFTLDRLIGAGASHAGGNWTVSAGIFGDTVSSSPFFSGFVGDENFAAAARATWAPVDREVNGVNQVLHLGGSVRYREAGDDQQFYQYQARAADLVLANRFVNTGRIGESDLFWGLEFAGVWGPLSVQGEYAQLDVDLPGGATIRNVPSGGNPVRRANPFLGIPDPTFYGWYIDASYFLTGETRPYRDGAFQRVKVKNPVTWSKGSGWGAWQIAARYDVLSLSDSAFNAAGGCPLLGLGVNGLTGATPAAIGQCGEQETWLIGLNWYLTDYVKLMFNYTQSELSSYPLTPLIAGNTTYPSGKTSVAGFDGATIKGFGMRAHIDW